MSLLRLVSERTRHAILTQLRLGESTVGALVGAMEDEQSNVSHHLATLRRAGLVAVRRDGRLQVYRLADAEVGRLLDQVREVAGRLERAAYTSSLGLSTDPAFHGYG